MHEDLATLFSRNLSLHHNPYQAPKPVEEPITYSITQHYHHSAHVATPQPSRSSSQPSQTEVQSAESVLANHGVDVSTLFPSQVELFKTADTNQQLRLIELWRISPPNYGGHALAQDLGTWPSTTFQQEEAMAKVRYERQQLLDEHIHPQSEASSGDAMETSGTITPIQGGDGRWSGYSEPYMESGYAALAQREYELSAREPSKDVYSHFGSSMGGRSYVPAADPVYKTIGDIHKYPNTEEMENQYGSFAQQSFHGHVYGAAVGDGGMDEEML